MNMFTTAKPIAGKVAKGRKADVVTVNTPGLHLYAALNALKANIEGRIEVVANEIKFGRTDKNGTIIGGMLDYFVTNGMKAQKKPDNYKGEDQGTVASLQMKARGAGSALSEEEQILFSDNDIPLEEIVDRDETFVINPAYGKDMDMLARVSEALEGLGLPADFILRQEKVSKVVATPASMDAIFGLEDVDLVKALVPLVSTFAIRATFAEDANPFEVVEAGMEAKDEAEPVAA